MIGKNELFANLNKELNTKIILGNNNVLDMAKNCIMKVGIE